MYATRVPAQEQYKLIMECRHSGLSDHQWCLNHDIKPGTFYKWVNRLRQKGCGDIPVATRYSDKEPAKQEVVRLDFNQNSSPVVSTSPPPCESSYPQQTSSVPVMELSIGNVNLRISNGIDPMLLLHTYELPHNFNVVKLLTSIICSNPI